MAQTFSELEEARVLPYHLHTVLQVSLLLLNTKTTMRHDK